MSINTFNSFCEKLSDELFVIDSSIPKTNYRSIDLSTKNTDLKSIDVASLSDMKTYIQEFLNKSGGNVAYGGYLEIRNLYQRSEYFKNTSNPLEERNIHLGVDIWVEAGTDVLAVLDGEVHSFANNQYFGDYGPTIILKHTFKDLEFYTLYGHLSLSSIPDLEMGQQFMQGQKIGKIGDSAINGDYVPHLHFQVILNIENHFGDYPGVCSQKDFEYYLDNCPDPNLLLKI